MQDVSILNQDWLLIGRQVRTGFDKLIDLLTVDANGSVIVIELKRDKTPRDVVAQAIDYAPWIVTLTDYQLIDIYQQFAERYARPYATLEEAFEAKFGISLDGVTLNENHQLVVGATQLDASSERIINYLNEHAQLPINAMFFNAFEDNGNHYLSRAWMIDPDEPTNPIDRKTNKDPGTGSFTPPLAMKDHGSKRGVWALLQAVAPRGIPKLSQCSQRATVCGSIFRKRAMWGSVR